jgi:hypothetical protein
VNMASKSTPLAGKRILVLEDEFLLALDAAASLEACGAQVVGPIYNVEGALALASRERLDGAMLDVNINGGNSLPVAKALQHRGIPMLFATGYGATPPGWPMGPVIDKPYSAAQVQDAFVRLLSLPPTLDPQN